MIFAKDGDINVDGTQQTILQDWCYLTNAIFKNLTDSEEEKFDMMKKSIEFVIETSKDFDEMEG